MSWLRDSLPIPERLLDGDILLYQKAITEPDQLYLRLLQQLPWQTGQITLFGQPQLIPRLQCWVADRPNGYQYSGQPLPVAPWIDELRTLRDDLNTRLDTGFNSVLCNLYRHGEDSMGWHSDDEPELGTDPVIASVTLGVERDFSLRRRGSSRQHGTLPLSHGSLLVMQAGMQRRWQHALPKRRRVTDARINLTFRQILT